MIAYFAATRTQCLEKNREKIQVIFFYKLNENLNKYNTGVGCLIWSILYGLTAYGQTKEDRS